MLSAVQKRAFENTGYLLLPGIINELSASGFEDFVRACPWWHMEVWVFQRIEKNDKSSGGMYLNWNSR